MNSYRKKDTMVHTWRKSTIMQSGARRTRDTHAPVYISGAEEEQVNSYRFLRITITQKLSWSLHITTLVKKAQKMLLFLQKLRKANRKHPDWKHFQLYSGWLNHQNITGTLLPSDNRSRSICCCTTRLQSSFVPQTGRLLNSSSILYCLICGRTQGL